jgi:hypothetical protein
VGAMRNNTAVQNAPFPSNVGENGLSTIYPAR